MVHNHVPMHSSRQLYQQHCGCRSSCQNFRVRTPGRERPYFASRYINGNDRDDEPHQIKILLNYTGGYGEIEGEDSDALLRMPDEAVANQIDNHCIGRNIRRPAFIEIYVAVNYGKLEVSFTWSIQMQHQSRIRQWVDSAQAMLQRTARELVEIPAQPTLSDLELFDGDHDNLDAIIEKASRLMDSLDSAEIADIYRATTFQRRMIKARHSGAQLFNVKQAYQFLLNDPINKVISRLSSAWQQVLQKHAALRSIIVEDNRNRLYNVVFKQTHTAMTTSWLTAEELGLRLSKTSSGGPELPTLELLLEEGRDTAHVLLQISHTVCDASSLAVMMNDLQAAYHGKLDCTSISGMVHKKLSARHNLSTRYNHASIEYWQRLFLDTKPANFPSGGGPYRGMYSSEDLTISYTPALRTLGERHGITLATTLQAAWALTLHSLLDQQDITFGYFSSGRDQPIPGIETAVGLFMNLCASRTCLDSATTISALLCNIQEDFSRGLQHQSACLDVVNEHVATPLFNPAFNFPKSSAAAVDERTEEEERIEFEAVGGTDPMDFAILVRLRDVQVDEGISVSLEYWPNQTKAEMVKRAGEVFVRAVAWIAGAEGCYKAIAFC